MREFLPRGSVTGIGSLPHTNAAMAVAFVAQHSPEIPFWPQLPQRTAQEFMIAQMLAPMLTLLDIRSPGRIDVLPGQLMAFCHQLRSSRAQLNTTTAAGFGAFEQACADGLFSQARALKGQISGPLTVARCLYTYGKSLGTWFDFVDELTDYLCRLAKWQVERLQRFGKPVIIYIDEPVLVLEPPDSQLLGCLRRLVQAIRSAGAVVGIHCCATGTPTPIFAAQPDIISFDAHVGLESFMTEPQTASFVDDGGWLSFGLIPTWENMSAFAPEASFARWLTVSTASNINLDRLVQQSLITATCGLALLPLEVSANSFIQAQRFARLLSRQEFY